MPIGCCDDSAGRAIHVVCTCWQVTLSRTKWVSLSLVRACRRASSPVQRWRRARSTIRKRCASFISRTGTQTSVRLRVGWTPRLGKQVEWFLSHRTVCSSYIFTLVNASAVRQMSHDVALRQVLLSPARKHCLYGVLVTISPTII